MSKMGLHDHLGSWNISYGQKNGQESNWQFDSRPLKIDNRLHFLAWRWHATYRWKALDKGYNFASYLTSIEGLKTKLWLSKVAKVPILRILGSPLGSSKQNDIRVHYKGEGGGFPQVRAVMNLASLCLPMTCPCIKMFQLRIKKTYCLLCAGSCE